jgi:hypothetical protein
VNIIKLPPVLPGELNLEAINFILQAGEATLDWSQVEDASLEHLAVLLAGIDLVEHGKILGIEMVPDPRLCQAGSVMSLSQVLAFCVLLYQVSFPRGK